MKRLIAIISACVLFSPGAVAQLPVPAPSEQIGKVADFSGLTARNHPRVIYSQGDFDNLKKIVELGENKDVCQLHKHLIKLADNAVKKTTKLEYKKDASGKRILQVSRDALARIVPCAYAYNLTGDKKYLKKAEENILEVCSFEDWNPSHYLDVAEMAAAVSLAYDWLYRDLKRKTRAEVVRVLRDYALTTCRDKKYTWWYKRIGNWNQVCNAGLVCSALAIYEHCPELAKEVIDDAVRTNRPAIEGIYGPDGAYPEGATYWGYGTIYQVLMLTALENAVGVDYDLSNAPGFLETGTFKIFARGATGNDFNFADNSLSDNSNYPLWYFAAKKQDPSMLYVERELVKDPKYRNSGHKGLIALAVRNAMDIKTGDDAKESTQKLYAAQGNTPVMMCRTGWEKNDLYLGIKGGQDGYLHGHMDGGSFVYDAYGVRWAIDMVKQEYSQVENGIKKLGGKLADYTQNSLRWKLFTHNCRQHNTLTVNDKDHDVTAFVNMTATEQTPERMAATFDLSPLFGGDLEKAERTAAICNEQYLEIKDVLAAPKDSAAHVRWTLVTEGQPQITDEGIILRKNDVEMLLKAEGAEVEYRVWSTDPMDYDSPLKDIDVHYKNLYICGYEIDIPAAAEVTIITTLKKK